MAGSIAPEVLFELGTIVGPIGGAVALAGSLLYLPYKLDRKRHFEIARALRSAGASPLSMAG